MINTFTVSAVVEGKSQRPLPMLPIRAESSADAWAKAAAQVQTMANLLGVPCRLVAVRWIAPDFDSVLRRAVNMSLSAQR